MNASLSMYRAGSNATKVLSDWILYDIFRRTPTGVFQRMTRVRTGAQSPSLTPSGDLIYAHFTSFGWKTYGIAASELLYEEVDFGCSPIESPSEVPYLQARRYRSFQAVLPIALAPMFRLDRSSDGRFLPRVGGFFRLRDAVENHTLSGTGWLGRDMQLRGRYTWHGLWPNLSISAGFSRTKLPWEERSRRFGFWEVSGSLPLRGDAQLRLTYGGFQVVGGALSEPHHSKVATLSLDLGDAGRLRRSERATGSALQAVATAAWSNGEPPFWRLEVASQDVRRAPVGGSAGHRLVSSVDLGWTDRHVALEDQLRVGGDHPYALRPGLYQGSWALPGYAPYSFAVDRLVNLGVAWRAPLARRLNQSIGALILEDVFVEVGGHVASLDEHLAGDALVRLKLGSTYLGRSMRSSMTFAWGGPSGNESGGWRTVLSLGTGF